MTKATSKTAAVWNRETRPSKSEGLGEQVVNTEQADLLRAFILFVVVIIPRDWSDVGLDRDRFHSGTSLLLQLVPYHFEELT